MLAFEEGQYYTPEEYLAAEEQSDGRHEYLAGYVFPMPDATRAHSSITVSIVGQLTAQLRGRCVPFALKMRLQVPVCHEIFYYYPDVMVECSGSTADFVEEPTIILEVSSPSTRRADYGDKLLNYLNLPSLKVYVIVDQEPCRLDVHRRLEDGGWRKEVLRDADDVLELPEIGCRLPLQAIYRRVLSSESPE